MRLKLRSMRQSLHLLPLAILLLLTWLQLSPPSALQPHLERLEAVFYDARLQFLPPWPNSVSNIQIVDIDEASLAAIGRMPWDRRHFTRLTQQLQQAGAVLVVYDVLFAEPQPNVLLSSLVQWPDWQKVPEAVRQNWQDYAEQQDQDRQFAEVMQQGEVVLANLLHHHPGPLPDDRVPSSSVKQHDQAEGISLSSFRGITGPVAALADAAAGQGFINAEADADGLVRRTALVQQFDGKLYPALALEAFRVYSLIEQIEPDWILQGQRATLQGVLLGNQLIRTDDVGRILLPFRGAARHYPYTSAAQVIAGDFAAAQFSEAVVFVGTSAAGLTDVRATPTDRYMPGVEIHATVFEALMSPAYIPYRPDWWRGAQVLQLLLLGGLAIGLLPRLGAVGSIVVSVAGLAGVLAANFWFWTTKVIDLPLLLPCLLLLVLAAYYLSAGFWLESRRRSQMKAVFDQYLPPAHIERLLHDPDSVSLDGERKLLTVLFCDIRGFTAISETMTPQQLKRWLNRVLTALTAEIQKYDGTIDKYVGDMVMAFWGAPLPDADHGQKAVKAALGMQLALDDLNQQFASEGLPLVQAGIGINSGEMNVGDMGSDFRRSYTVIGDAVNLAARLEALTAYYSVPMLVSESTKALADQLQYLLVDKVQVKGKQQAVRIYLPLSPTLAPDDMARFVQFSQALDRYYCRDFPEALQRMRALQQETADKVLNHLILLYMLRIEALVKQTLSPDWDGSFRHQTKS